MAWGWLGPLGRGGKRWRVGFLDIRPPCLIRGRRRSIIFSGMLDCFSLKNLPIGIWSQFFDFFKGRSGIASPVSRAMPAGLDNILAAQAMMPVVSLSEMAGSKFDNEVGAFAYTDQILGRVGAWRNVIKRVHDIPEYVERFMDVFPELQRKGKY